MKSRQVISQKQWPKKTKPTAAITRATFRKRIGARTFRKQRVLFVSPKNDFLLFAHVQFSLKYDKVVFSFHPIINVILLNRGLTFEILRNTSHYLYFMLLLIASYNIGK